jgi:hypothetical protein
MKSFTTNNIGEVIFFKHAIVKRLVKLTAVPNVYVIHGSNVAKDIVPKPEVAVTTCLHNHNGTILFTFVLAMILCWALPPRKVSAIQ